MSNIKSGDVFKHYKGGIYTVLHIGYDANNTNNTTPENIKVVIYIDHANNSVWVRNLDEFLETLDNKIKRFEKNIPIEIFYKKMFIFQTDALPNITTKLKKLLHLS